MPLKGRLKPSSRITLCKAQAAGVVGRIAPGKPFGIWTITNAEENDAMTQQQIYARLDQLEMSLNGDDTDDDTRADILDEIADLESRLA